MAAISAAQLQQMIDSFQMMAQQLQANSSNAGSTNAATLASTLESRIGKFLYDPEMGLTFEQWYKRYGNFIEQDGKDLDDSAKVRLLKTESGPGCNIDHLAKLRVIRGNIVERDVLMIVNAANNGLVKGGGVDDAIHMACTPQRRKLVAELAKKRKVELAKLFEAELAQVGEAGMANMLRAEVRKKYEAEMVQHGEDIAHAVGPNIHTGEPTPENRNALQACYQGTLDQLLHLETHGRRSKTIAFPCISVGVFAYPPIDAAVAALEAMLNWMATTPNSEEIEEIRLIIWEGDKQNEPIYKKLIGQAKLQLESADPPKMD